MVRRFMDISVGDYILSKEKQLYVIVDIYKDTTGTYYDIKSYKADIPFGDGVFMDIMYDYEYIRAVPRNRLKHMGIHIKSEEITKTLKILYG